MSDAKKANYSTFKFFRRNVKILMELRPDLYTEPNENGYSILGIITKREDFPTIFEGEIKKIWAINSSIVLNTTSFFEGFLENILLRKIGSTLNFDNTIKSIIEEYQENIIKISSVEMFEREFKKIFGTDIKKVINNIDRYEYIKKFYVIRHLLVHGSMIKTDHVKENLGSRLIHDDNKYNNLIDAINKRFAFSKNINIEFYWLITCSKIIDDFHECVIEVSKDLIKNLIQKELLSTSEQWGDYCSWSVYGGSLDLDEY